MSRAVRRIGIVVFAFGLAGCGGDDAVAPVDAPPVIAVFAPSTTLASVGETIDFQLDAADDVGLDSAVVSYGDSARTVLPLRGRKHLSAALSRFYADSGHYTASLVVFDTRRQTDSSFVQITVTLP
jgi:hypothetical protein